MPKKVEKKVVNPNFSPSRGIAKSTKRVATRKNPWRSCRNARPLAQSLDFVSEDSDDDYSHLEEIDLLARVRALNTAVVASTSNADSCPNTASPVLNPNLQRDLMDTVDNFLEDANTNKTEPKVDDLKSFAEYRKEKYKRSLLDKFKAPKEPPETATKPAAAGKIEEKEVNVWSCPSCPICFEPFAGRPCSVTICGHIFCTECITLTAQRLKKCPTCREDINAKKIHPLYF